MIVAKITLDVIVPENVTQNDLAQFILFKYFGHSINDDALSKFEYEELEVEDFEINMR